MGRKTFRKVITSDEVWNEVNKKNKKLMDRFLKEKKTRCSVNTIKNYDSDLHIFFTWNYEENDDKYFVDIKKLDFADFFSYCVSELKWGSARFARMRSCLSSLSEFIIKFYDEEYPTYRNIILKSIEAMPKEPRRKKTIMTEEQVNKLLNYLTENERYQEACLFALAISSGARKSELLRFDINLIDENNTAFDGLFIETKDKIVCKGRGRDGKLLYKYIVKDIFLPYYKRWIEKRKEIMEKNNVEEHNKLFIKSNGQPITSTDAIDYWKDSWSEILGIDFYFHSARHYLCTLLSKIGLEQDLIIEIYGWSSGGEMYKIYNDLTAKDRQWKGTAKLKDALENNIIIN